MGMLAIRRDKLKTDIESATKLSINRYIKQLPKP